MHPYRLAEFDAALRQFFLNLDDRFRSRVTILTLSEFGRTPWANDSGGTDHGAASMQFVIGTGVAGGLRGTYPSLRRPGGAELQRWDDLQCRRSTSGRCSRRCSMGGWVAAGTTSPTSTHWPACSAPARARAWRPGPPRRRHRAASPGVARPRARHPVAALGTWRRLPAGDRTTVEIDPLTAAGISPSRRDRRGAERHGGVADERQLGDGLGDLDPAAGALGLSFPPGSTVPNLVISKVGASSRVNAAERPRSDPLRRRPRGDVQQWRRRGARPGHAVPPARHPHRPRRTRREARRQHRPRRARHGRRRQRGAGERGQRRGAERDRHRTDRQQRG